MEFPGDETIHVDSLQHDPHVGPSSAFGHRQSARGESRRARSTASPTIPWAATHVARRVAIASYGCVERSTASRISWTSDDTLADVTEAVHRRWLAVQMSNDTYSAEDRRSAADEIVQLRVRLVELTNTKVNGRYLFGGLANAAQPSTRRAFIRAIRANSSCLSQEV